MPHLHHSFKAPVLAGLVAVFAVSAPASSASAPAPSAKPNILFILADNLGYGEVGAYGGGETRGAPTPRLDRLANEGLRLTNMNMETQCTPSRSSLMTGRFAIRSGTYAVPFGGVPEGLTQWEVTIAESLSAAGYATALHGKWHLGSHDGRLPNDQGFDEWFGIPAHDRRIAVVGVDGLFAGHRAAGEDHGGPEGREEQGAARLRRHPAPADRRGNHATLDRVHGAAGQARASPSSCTCRSPSLTCPPSPIRRLRAGPATAIGPTCSPRWTATSGSLLDALDRLGIADDTLVIFTSDNGPEYFKPWDGWAGPWRGQYFTALEGGIRVPFMVRWPGKIAPGRVSNEIVHGVDMFATLASLAGAKVPD